MKHSGFCIAGVRLRRMNGEWRLKRAGLKPAVVQGTYLTARPYMMVPIGTSYDQQGF